jgi:hypothetical protein
MARGNYTALGLLGNVFPGDVCSVAVGSVFGGNRAALSED